MLYFCYYIVCLFLAGDQEILGSPPRGGAVADSMEEEVTTQPAQGAQEESSEDEMVFEAYVSSLEVTADQGDAHLDDEVLKVQISRLTEEYCIMMIIRISLGPYPCRGIKNPKRTHST